MEIKHFPGDERIESREEKRKVIVSFIKPFHIAALFKDTNIYIQLLPKGKQIMADASSKSRFESPNNHMFSHDTYSDSNFIVGKEIMPYEDFIDIIARLNDARIIDHTPEEGALAMDYLSKHNISIIEKICQIMTK
jgi:hypothetical protein